MPELKDWKPSLPTSLTPTSRLGGEIQLQQLCIIDGLQNFTDTMGISDDGVGIVTETRGNRADLMSGLKAVYPDLLAMEIEVFSDLIHKLEVQRNGSTRGDEVIRRDDIKRSVQQALSKHNSTTDGILFWLDWSREEADVSIFTSRPPILPDISDLDEYMVYADATEDREAEEEDEDDAYASATIKTLKNAKIIVSVSKHMLKSVKGDKTIAAPQYSAAQPTIEGIIWFILANQLLIYLFIN
jgi:hypothetical protein